MDFKIDNKTLKVKNFSKNTFEVKSQPVKYSVCLTESDPLEYVTKTYKKGDVILIDKKLVSLYNFDSLSNSALYSVEAVERNKTIETCLDLVRFLSNIGFNKGNTLHVIGGGIIQDIGSFTAAVYKRGVNWVLFPSTLLSMADSCIGGKNGINYNGTKNQLALFSSPTSVVICTKFIKTLENKEIKSGLGEALKLLAMGGPELLKQYVSMVRNGKVLNESDYLSLIKNSLAVKKEVIEFDEFELTIRQCLNYGHTIGHALETLSKYEIPHGEAVAIGMLLVNKLYNTDTHELNAACKDLIDFEKLKSVDLAGLKDLILKDKKTFGDQTTFIVLKNYGETVFIKETINDNFISRIVDEINNIK